MQSPQLGNARDVLVCLPPSYDALPHRSWPVLYLHDGQNLFDRGTSFAEEWRADEALRTAADSGLEAILVGIPNANESRIDEYSPFHDAKAGGGGKGDAYVSFLTDTVKPAIDEAFRTSGERLETGIAGSSMGGLISLYAFFQRSDVFGFVGAMSPALWFARRAFFPWLKPRPRTGGRVYLDAGTKEGPFVLADVARLRDVLVERGYRLNRDLRFVLETGGRHDERAWGRRLLGVIQFMLVGAKPAASQPEPAG
jgi:glycogen operon protein